MTKTSTRRLTAGLSIGLIAMAALAGCNRQSTDPASPNSPSPSTTPTPSTSPSTSPSTGSGTGSSGTGSDATTGSGSMGSGSGTGAMPPASAASR